MPALSISSSTKVRTLFLLCNMQCVVSLRLVQCTNEAYAITSLTMCLRDRAGTPTHFHCQSRICACGQLHPARYIRQRRKPSECQVMGTTMEETVSRRVQETMEAVNGTTDMHANGCCSNGRAHSNGPTAKREHDRLPFESPAAPASESALSPALSGRDYVVLAVCVGCGFAFGIAAEKGKGTLLSDGWGRRIVVQFSSALPLFLPIQYMCHQ